MQQETAIIYNVTNKVSKNIDQEWLQWMQQHHIPEVIATGCFFKAIILQLKDVDDSEGPTYAIQYHAESLNDYERYINLHANSLRQKCFDKWSNQFIAFRTIMQVVN